MPDPLEPREVEGSNCALLGEGTFICQRGAIGGGPVKARRAKGAKDGKR